MLSRYGMDVGQGNGQDFVRDEEGHRVWCLSCFLF